MPLNGYIPELGAAVSVSLTSVFRGMNTSLTEHENAFLFGRLECEFLQILYQHKFPGFTDFACVQPRAVEVETVVPFVV